MENRSSLTDCVIIFNYTIIISQRSHRSRSHCLTALLFSTQTTLCFLSRHSMSDTLGSNLSALILRLDYGYRLFVGFPVPDFSLISKVSAACLSLLLTDRLRRFFQFLEFAGFSVGLGT